jgi:hypothetical protein
MSLTVAIPGDPGGEKSSPISRLRAMRIRAISITCSRGDEQSAGEGVMSTGAERGKAEAELAQGEQA